MLVDKSKYVAFIHFPKSYTQDLPIFIDHPDDYDMQSLPYMHFAKHSMQIQFYHF